MRFDWAPARRWSWSTTRRLCALDSSTLQAMIKLRRRTRRDGALRRGVGDTSSWSPALMRWWADQLQPFPHRSATRSPGTTRSRCSCLIGLVVWPAAIALCRGYRRNRIGIGFDEPGAVMRAGMLVVVAGALPAGFMAVPTGALDPHGALH